MPSSFPRKPYIASRPGGLGIDERQIHIASGLRTASMSGMCVTDADAIVDNATPANQTSWTALTLVSNSARLPVPCTPVITITHGNASPTAHVAQFRFRGYDQFGVAIQEILPQITTGPTDQNDLSLQVCSKVFAYVTEVAYLLSGFQTSTTFDVGYQFIWNQVAYAAEDGGDSEIFGGANMGIGLPLRVSPYGPNLGATLDPNTDTSITDPEILSFVMINHTNSDAIVVVPSRAATTATTDEGFQVGISASGYEGCAHKIGIELDATGAGNGTFPTTAAGTDDLAHADTVSFYLNMRSSIGTGRRSGVRSSYVR